MANTITKYQVQYLKDRLDTIKREKVKDFREEHDTVPAEKNLAIYDAIKSGTVKLKARKDIESGRYYSTYVENFFDMEKFDKAYDKAVEEITKTVSDYEAKLEAAITDILDSVVLRGLDIQEAVAKFEKM